MAFNQGSIASGLLTGIGDLITGGPGKRQDVKTQRDELQLSIDAFNLREQAAQTGQPLSIFDTDSRAAETLDQLAAQAGITISQLLGLPQTTGPQPLPQPGDSNFSAGPRGGIFGITGGLGGLLPTRPPPQGPNTMPFHSSSPFNLVAESTGGIIGGASGGFDFGGLVGGAIAALPGIITAFKGGGAVAMPGGAPIPGNQERIGMPHVATSGPGAVQRATEFFGLGVPGGDLVPTGVGSLQSVACITPRMTGSVRLPSRVDVPTSDHHGNVRFTTFKNMGRPLLWSGDLAAAKRVRKVAAKARRRVGGR